MSQPEHDATMTAEVSKPLPQLDREGDGCPRSSGGSCVIIPIEGLRSPRCERQVERRLRRACGLDVRASQTAGVVRIDPGAALDLDLAAAEVRKCGFRLKIGEAHPCAREPLPCAAAGASPPAAGWRKKILGGSGMTLVLIGGMLLAAGFAVLLADGPTWIRIALLAAAAVAVSTRTFPDAIHALKQLELDVDVLMFVAAGGASILGHYEEGVFLLFLFGLGNAGEALALSRARGAIAALRSVAPETARRIEPDGSEVEIAADNVRTDDRLAVLPFERLPADGVVETGQTSVNQAAITGESMPVDKAPGDELFAGTINGDQRIVMVASRPASESTLTRLIRLVEQAQTEKSPVQLLTDRIERWYVPAVFIATMCFVVAPPLLGFGSWADWFYRSMAFLTAASPCALAIGGPAAVLCGIARAARIGVLIKGGGPLSTLGKIETLCLDKTGTLTLGRPEVVEIIPLDGTDGTRGIALAAAVEAQTSHPLASAIVNYAKAKGIAIDTARDVRQITGIGVEGKVDHVSVTVGRLGEPTRAALDADQIALLDAAEVRGETLIACAVDGRPALAIALADTLRVEAKDTIASIRALGIRDVVMLTGDRTAVARSIGAKLGIDHIEAELMPEDKLRTIETLSKTSITAMLGDGVNDAPALARAHIGIAIGAAGADVAMETADVVLMGSTLDRLPEAIAISRAARRVIFQNLVIALGVIAIVAPLAILGKAGLGLAVVFHEGSTVLVVLSSLRLLRLRDQRHTS